MSESAGGALRYARAALDNYRQTGPGAWADPSELGSAQVVTAGVVLLDAASCGVAPQRLGGEGPAAHAGVLEADPRALVADLRAR